MCDINRTELIFYERENIPYNSNTIAALKKKWHQRNKIRIAIKHLNYQALN